MSDNDPSNPESSLPMSIDQETLLLSTRAAVRILVRNSPVAMKLLHEAVNNTNNDVKFRVALAYFTGILPDDVQ